MSRSIPTDTLPPTARTIALLLASTPTIQDAQPGVLHQLLEFSHRYTSQVLSDALVYAEHAGRPGKIEMDDVVLAIQARVGWELGGRVPKEYILSLAAQANAIPLPSVPEVFGVRVPTHSLANVNFDLIPNKPPPNIKQYDEEIEEVEEEESDEEVALPQGGTMSSLNDADMHDASPHPPNRPFQTPSDGDADMASPAIDGADREEKAGEGSEADGEEHDGLFAGADDDSDGDDAMEPVDVPEQLNANGIKRKLVEEEDYD